MTEPSEPTGSMFIAHVTYCLTPRGRYKKNYLYDLRGRIRVFPNERSALDAVDMWAAMSKVVEYWGKALPLGDVEREE